MVKGGEQLFRLAVIGIDHKRFTPVISVKIPQDVPLRIQQKGVRALSFSKVTNIVRNHPVQPAHSVSTGERNLGAIAEVVNAASTAQSSQLRLRILESRSRHRASILADNSAQSLFLQSSKSHTCIRL